MACSQCPNTIIENRDLGLCATCNTRRRKLEKLGAQHRAIVTPLPKVTEKRAKENAQYWPLRKQYLEDHPHCEIKLMGCTRVATEIHHCSMSHKDYLRISTWKSGCNYCHGQVERVLSAHERKVKGLLIKTDN